MDKYLTQYLIKVQATKAENTYKSYRRTLIDIWFPKGKTDLRLEYITSVIQSWQCSQNTKAQRCAVLKGYIEFYSNFKNINNLSTIKEMLSDVKFKEVVPEVATIEQYKAVIQECTDIRIEICIDLMFQNGLRHEEVANILVEDYNMEESTIIIRDTKNTNDYLIYLTKELNDKIANFATHNGKFLLITKNNTKLDTGYIRKCVKSVCAKAGFPELHCHSFRHGSAITLLDNNVNLFVIKEHLRHKSLQSTQRYLHISKRHKTEVRNIFTNIC